jgi:hypothetical protein
VPKHKDRLRVISESAWTDADLLTAVRRLAAEAGAQEEWLRRRVREIAARADAAVSDGR